MEPFGTLAATVVPLRLANVDTDQLQPGRFLRKPRSDGYDNYLFHDLRRNEDGSMREDFPLNQPQYQSAEILVADRNFGGGSSREGAVYALADAGFRCVIAASFGDIFRSNCAKNGVLPVELPIEAIEKIWEMAEADPSAPLTVDLATQTVRLANDPETFGFEIDPFVKECLMEGKDDIDLTLAHSETLSAFERSYGQDFPWRTPTG
ncbi:3-isopropylmalate dehydratase small subunit [Thalassobaculum salexigens]|uniref:3-isopropylmalate dehydratase small subunit n=1 Tax=Thalassobaculum salexigens TaxID=455360 RepID=UPI00248DB464|nr:3-isopropylmalate dehydratase small subunit [Thalassobaculum salexigens]